jgi:hypothetical protein
VCQRPLTGAVDKLIARSLPSLTCAGVPEAGHHRSGLRGSHAGTYGPPNLNWDYAGDAVILGALVWAGNGQGMAGSGRPRPSWGFSWSRPADGTGAVPRGAEPVPLLGASSHPGACTRVARRGEMASAGKSGLCSASHLAAAHRGLPRWRGSRWYRRWPGSLVTTKRALRLSPSAYARHRRPRGGPLLAVNTGRALTSWSVGSASSRLAGRPLPSQSWSPVS